MFGELITGAETGVNFCRKRFILRRIRGPSYHQFEHIPMPKNRLGMDRVLTPLSGNMKLLHSDDICIAQKEAERSLKMNGKKIKRLNLYKNINAKIYLASEYVTVLGLGYIENI